jgi:hypothetical protein
LLFAIAALVLGGGCYAYGSAPVNFTPQEIQANPSLLNGKTMRGGTFAGLTLKDVTLTGTKFTEIKLEQPVFQNVTFVNAQFDTMDMRDITFTNVRFDNCTFINAHMRGGTFTDVVFKDGKFAYRGDPDNWYNPTYITEIKFSNVVFDGLATNTSRMDAIKGSATFKNMNNMKDFGNTGSIINGRDLTLRVDNCHLEGFTFAAMFGKSTAYVTNSTFKSSGFVGGTSKVMYFENCRLLDGTLITSPETVVVKNSTVCAVFKGQGTWYLEGCKFVVHSMKSNVGSTFLGGKKSRGFVLGSKRPALWFGMMGGVLYIFDMRLEQLEFSSTLSIDPLVAVNLRNVTIHGGDWQDFAMKGGQCENVKIYPEVQVGNTNLGNVEMHNVTFPDGNPWRGKEAITINATTSAKPFAWPEVRVPTPEELGLKDTLPVTEKPA